MTVTPRPGALTALTALALLSLATAPALAQRPTPASEPVPSPVIVPDGTFDIVLMTQASAAALGDTRRLSEYFRSCRRHLAIDAADSVAVIRSRTWEWDSGATADEDNLTLLVSRTIRTEVDCAAGEGLRAIALARGFRMTSDTLYPYEPAIAAVRVHRGDRLVPVEDAERLAATRLTLRGLVTLSAGMMRITVPIDSVAPAADGRVSDLVLEITTADTTLPHRIAIPWSALRTMWEQALRARSARLGADVARANGTLLAELAKPNLRGPAQLEARLQLGLNFVGAGDTSSARVVLGEAVRMEPCLTLDASSPALAREIVSAAHRPPDRCRASIGRAALQATLLPGFGQTRGTNRKVFGAIVMGAVVGSLIASQSAKDEAKSLYSDYLAVDGTDPQVTANLASTLYDQAESRRLTGRRLVMVGAGLWGASIIEATWTEYRLQRRLDRVREYRARPRSVSFAPSAGPGRFGITVNFF